MSIPQLAYVEEDNTIQAKILANSIWTRIHKFRQFRESVGMLIIFIFLAIVSMIH